MFKVGDKVRFIGDKEKINNWYHETLDKELTISVLYGNNICTFVELLPNTTTFYLEDFELVEEKPINESKFEYFGFDKIVGYAKEDIKVGEPLIFKNGVCDKISNVKDEEPKPLDTYHGEIVNFYHYVDMKFKGLDMVYAANEIDELDFNYFRNKDQAEQARKHLQITCALLNFRAENDKNYDGYTKLCKQYYSIINVIGKDIFKKSEEIIAIFSGVLFSSENIAQSALDMLKRKGLV